MDATTTKVNIRGQRRFGMLALALCGVAACRGGVRTRMVSRAQKALGAVFTVAAWGRDSSALRRAVERAFADHE